ncbi:MULTISPECIES: Fe-S cluster assembly protein SufD [unclassified Cyanobium]|uniref:Fe-S cluster assembly protein SufD n=1 Tax=unclassified Cyanobium TaxID=2627006 RepID=UPI0020CC30CF|nr:MULTISPECIES: Fe-S cluster assembly protein SufD [unclassified Cyanobium]MCP9861050.1 Fe-S cluster assembly protein SufD [Cyanobium sp. Cruz-8H5]MCP9868276.1 Fe-S cluster assembly protein SufD [Cyanobium sp. Cruz-8D1]
MVAASLSTPTAAAGAGPGGWVTALLAEAASGADALAASRERAAQALAQTPLPTRRDEAWRFTDLAPLTGLKPSLLSPAPTAQPEPAGGSLRLTLNGHSDPLAGINLPAGLEPISGDGLSESLGQVLAATGSAGLWPVLLNGATAQNVLALRVRGTVATTLELVSDAGADEGILPLRLLLILEPDASLEVLQVHRSGGPNLTSVVLEARLGEGAELRHGLLAPGAEAACLLATVAVEQATGSRYSGVSAHGGWALGRLEPRLVQREGAAHSALKALQLADGRQISDTHSQMVFEGPDGRLEQLHKAVADGQGRSVFNGAVQVPRAAQRTNAAQLSRNLLLSDRARIDTKPELEIVADDVRCAHGATVSRLQQDELFYLQSRGIAADQAARLLLRGFCEEVLQALPAAAAAWQPLASLLGEQGR